MTMTAKQSRPTGGYYAQQWTVRDEYAAAALPTVFKAGYMPVSWDPRSIAMDAFAMADAMLAERRRGSGKELATDIAEVLSRPKRDYTDARGAVVPPAGAPSPEDAIRAGRGDQPTHEHRYACFDIYGKLSIGCPDYDPPDAVNPYAKPYDDALAAQERLRRHLPAHEGEL